MTRYNLHLIQGESSEAVVILPDTEDIKEYIEPGESVVSTTELGPNFSLWPTERRLIPE